MFIRKCNNKCHKSKKPMSNDKIVHIGVALQETLKVELKTLPYSQNDSESALLAFN